MHYIHIYTHEYEYDITVLQYTVRNEVYNVERNNSTRETTMYIFFFLLRNKVYDVQVHIMKRIIMCVY